MLALALFIASCTKDETPTPAPQVTPDRSTVSTSTNAAEKVTLTIVAPGKFSALTATADVGTVALANIAGVGTTSGTADVSYTAPDNIGNYTITITVTDGTQKTSTITVPVSVTAKPPVNLPAGNISGTLVRNTTYLAQGSLLVPAGQSLTIPEGVTIIFDGDGTQGTVEFAVSGNLYILGTKALPVFLTVPVAKRTTANIFTGLWGGLQATSTAAEVVLKYANIEFAGAPAGANNTSLLSGIYAAGVLRYGLNYGNVNGKFVMQNSRIAYTQDDGMRIQAGNILVSNNLFESCGSTGGESMNIKTGTVGDIAFNVMYGTATNGMKISNTNAITPQTNINTYNNTIISGGFRQTSTTAHGGSINYEKGSRGQIYNNLIVNCKFGTRIVSDADQPNIYLGYNLYYGSESGIVSQFYPTSGVITGGTSKETANDVTGAVAANDPKFVNFSPLSTFSSTTAASTTGLSFLPATTDFHLQAGSPAIGKGKTGFTVGSSITAGGVVYTVPAPSSTIGAYGTN